MRARTILRWLRARVDVWRVTGVDAHGQPEHAVTLSVPARVVHAQKRAVTVQGVEFTSGTQVLLLEPVAVGDSLAVEGEFRPIRSLRRMRGVRGGAELVEAQL